MKKVLLWTWYIFTALIIISTVSLTAIIMFKPHTLQYIIGWMMHVVDFLWWKNYLLAGTIGILESIPFLNMAIPWQTFMIIIAGFVAQFNYFGILLIVTLASIIGDTIAYFWWKYHGKSLLRTYGPAFGFTESRVDSLMKTMKKHNHRTIFASKRNSYTRGVLPFIAWTGHINFWEFMLYNMLGSLAYATVLVSLAKVFVGHYQKVIPYVRWIGLGILIIAGIWYLITYIRNERKTR